MHSQLAKTSRGTIEYTRIGDGPVILVSHGTSANCFSMETAAALIKAGFTMITPSRPGYGKTPSSVGPTTETAAASLIELMDELGIQTFGVNAISGGGPTGITLAANYPDRVTKLAMIAAISHPEARAADPLYPDQIKFYGPMHNFTWGMLQLISKLSPTSMARQTMATFSMHDPDDTVRHLTPEDVHIIAHFYQGRSSRHGALIDLAQTVEETALAKIQAPVLVIHSREDKSVPFSQAEWTLSHVQRGELCESGITGHFFWVGPDVEKINKGLVEFHKG